MNISKTNSTTFHCLFKPFAEKLDFELEPNNDSIPISEKNNDSINPLKCDHCDAFFNQYSSIIQPSSLRCPFCEKITPIQSSFTKYATDTIHLSSYVLDKGIIPSSKSFLTVFVIDTICDKQELNALKENLIKNLENYSEKNGNNLNENMHLYALISTNSDGTIKIHYSNKKDSIVFSMDSFKTKYYSERFNFRYFIDKITMNNQLCYFQNIRDLIKELNSLEITSSITTRTKRPKRSFGLALFLATVLVTKLQCSQDTDWNNSMIISFLTGPCTKGPGKVLSRDYKINMRQFNNFNGNKNNSIISDLKSSKKFYDKLFRHSFGKVAHHLYISSLDQVGFLEMSSLYKDSACVQQFDTFTGSRFMICLKKNFELMRNDNVIYNLQMKTLKVPHITKLKLFNDKLLTTTLIPSSLTIPLEIITRDVSSNTSSEEPIIQFQITFEKNNRRYLKIVTIPLVMNNESKIQDNNNNNDDIGSLEIELYYFLKSLSFILLHSTNPLQLYKPNFLIENIHPAIVNQFNTLSFSSYYKYILNSPFFNSEGISPDERTFFINLCSNSNINMISKLLKPKLYNIENQGTRMVELNFDKESLILCKNKNENILVDGGNFIGIIRNSTDKVNPYDSILDKIRNERFPTPRVIHFTDGLSGPQDRYLKCKLVL
ncbi:GTPase-activating protein NEL1 NDAI_0C02170 [Naumovozyma dairenensis CBS 421]|uniref:Protein transport protein SEC23 n=1 Tax=Naumovozyma dairenensis (strain ATCC 10597 / BCRC 20456 / CBS 421 / NBRC 0211 / NRRL Y-12639) TaxID=1071378 RepID=G0W7W6_NAUDC|nr:hypothetical protein NDAI_0C02170 [Naumovozyma dairenensis CBS 421]CCD23877.1 hypothetical protein NDAI_0C02170 [Naumovozyma dairenensis CBS 421]